MIMTSVEMNLLSIVYTQFKQDGASDGALVVNLNQQTLRELISKAEQGNITAIDDYQSAWNGAFPFGPTISHEKYCG